LLAFILFSILETSSSSKSTNTVIPPSTSAWMATLTSAPHPSILKATLTAQTFKTALPVTRTPTPTPTRTPLPRITIVLEFPEQGATYQNPIIFEWKANLFTGQTYRVNAWHPTSGSQIESPLLTTPRWTSKLPEEQYGEWKWNVSVLQNNRIVVTSADCMFWFDPYPR
jgi:hypothetical protein